MLETLYKFALRNMQHNKLSKKKVNQLKKDTVKKIEKHIFHSNNRTIYYYQLSAISKICFLLKMFLFFQLKVRSVLDKYDDEIDGAKKQSFRLGNCII